MEHCEHLLTATGRQLLLAGYPNYPTPRAAWY